MSSNIAQIEFFLAGKDSNQSLEKFMEECHDRMDQGSPIKLCFRIYDENHEITTLSHKINDWENQYGTFGELITRPNWQPNLFDSLRHKWLLRKRNSWKDRLEKLLRQMVCDHLRLRKDIAIECPDRSYRFVQNDERYELEGSVKRTVNCWVFVFAPNDILANTNKTVTFSM